MQPPHVDPGAPTPDQLTGRDCDSVQCQVSRLLIVFCLVSGASSTYAGPARTPADDAALAERSKANSEIDFIDRVFDEEAHRLTSFPNAPPSPSVAKLSDSSTNGHLQLSDTSVPLHLRLIERERLTFVSSIAMIKASLRGDCPEQVVDVPTFADPIVRKRELQRIQCQRIRRSLYQQGTHVEGLAQEKSILELKLPPYTEDNMLSRQRARNRSQDAELTATFKSAEAVDNAIEQFLKFLDSHSSIMRVTKGQFLFATEADAATFTQLQNNVVKMQSLDKPATQY